MIDPKFLRELIDYNPETGALIWRERTGHHFSQGERAAHHRANQFNSTFAGKEAFGIGPDGYRKGRLLNRPVRAHRVAFAHYYGRWPTEVDHINRDRSDNRITNLREVTHRENSINRGVQSNNTSGVAGVTWSKSKMKWTAHIKHNGRQKHLGTFSCFEDAKLARTFAEERLANG